MTGSTLPDQLNFRPPPTTECTLRRTRTELEAKVLMDEVFKNRISVVPLYISFEIQEYVHLTTLCLGFKVLTLYLRCAPSL